MDQVDRVIQSNSSRMQALIIVLRISFGFFILKLVFELFRYSLWTKITKGVPISPRQIWLVESLETNALKIQTILFIISAIFFISWKFRSYQNLGQFQRLVYPEKMAIASWFIPLFSFVGPILIYSEIVKGYEELLAKQNYIRRDTRRKSIKNWWWISWVAAQIVFVFSFGHERSNFFYSVFATGLFLLSNILLISSLNDTQMMERGIGELKQVKTVENSPKEALEEIL